MTKICKKCKKELKSINFYKRSKSPDGLSFMCKHCYQLYYDQNKAKICKYRKEYFKNDENKKKRSIVYKRWYYKNLEKHRIYMEVYYALKTGKIKKLDCARCGGPSNHAHHSDYSKPLEVTWLCTK